MRRTDKKGEVISNKQVGCNRKLTIRVRRYDIFHGKYVVTKWLVIKCKHHMCNEHKVIHEYAA